MVQRTIITKQENGSFASQVVNLTEAEMSEYSAKLAAPKVKRRVGEFREFLSLFTPQEQVNIKTAAMDPENVSLALWYDKALGGAEMSLDHAETAAGLSALVDAGLISEARKTEILAADFDLI